MKWITNGLEIQTDDNKESLIAEVYCEHKDAKANARLIASAPVLLQLCKDLLGQIHVDLNDNLIRLAKEIINEAEAK